ncbi:hypothetical protein QZH41_003235 [Actinostola sp. cb2023]|nr:hypothetical protein QZH41_003235 [Actinostola sp. cb2023]
MTVAVIMKEKLARRNPHLFLLNMAIADLIVTVVYMPRMVVMMLYGNIWLVTGTFGLVLCHAVPFLHHLAILVSVFIILGATIDRFCAMVFPLRNIMTRTVTRIIVVATWLLSAILRSPYLIRPILVQRGASFRCFSNIQRVFGKAKQVYYDVLVWLYCISLVVTIVLYSITVIKLRKTKAIDVGVANDTAQYDSHHSCERPQAKKLCSLISCQHGRRGFNDHNNLHAKNGDPRRIPVVDLGFAICAGSSNADETLKHMKNVIKSVVTRYGTSRIHYALMTFDDDANIRISFKEKLSDPSSLLPFINVLSKSSGMSSVEKALEEGPLEFAAVDIGFAVSSTSLDASTIFTLIKNSIKSIASTYWTKNIRYGIIIFGAQPFTVLDFGAALPSKDILMMKIDAIQRRTGSPNMIETLKSAKQMFERRGSRPHAKKILVVMIDNRVEQRRSLMSPAATPLEYSGIRVIPIVVGTYANPLQLQSITPLRNNIVEVPKTEDPTILGEKIVYILIIITTTIITNNNITTAIIVFIINIIIITTIIIITNITVITNNITTIIIFFIINILIITTIITVIITNITTIIIFFIIIINVVIITVNLVFAMTASSADSDKNFAQIKSVINSIIRTYTMEWVHYGVIVYGPEARARVGLSAFFPTDKVLRSLINSLPKPSGTPAIDKALKEAEKMFDAASSRPKARNVLVLFIDKKSSNSPGDIIRAARPLEEDRVKVIPVAIGNEVDMDELEYVTPEKGNVMTGRNDEDPGQFGKRIMHKVFKKVDIAFALQASTADADETFSKMKRTIKMIIDQYGTKKLHYAVIVYADTATTKLNFGEREQLPSDEALKQLIDSVPRGTGQPAVVKAFDEAEKLFESSAARPQALKVLVVMHDKRSTSALNDVKDNSRDLEDGGIEVIPVGIGNEVDPTEISGMTSHSDNIIKTKKPIDPGMLAEEIIKRAFKVRPKIPRVDMAFTINAASANSDQTSKFMKDIIKYIIDKYGTNRIHYSLIIYGHEPSVKITFQDRMTNPRRLNTLLDTLPRFAAGSDLQKAIRETKKLFDSDAVRPDARKVVVIMTDVMTSGDKESAKRAAKDLEANDIEVITVAIGNEADKRALVDVTPNKVNAINATTKEQPSHVGEEIIKRVNQDPLETVDIDLGFAISATSIQASSIFTLMKDTLKTIINTYGTDNIHYSTIVFGRTPTLVTSFNDVFPDKEALVRRLQQMASNQGIPDLNAAMRLSKRTFKGSGSRDKARKILVVIVDNKSGNGKQEIISAARSLEEDSIRVIPVAVGQYADPSELVETTPLKGTLIKVPSSERPTPLAKKIMDKIRDNIDYVDVPEADLVFAISAAAANSAENFNKMRSIIKSMVDKYSMGKMRYAVVAYGSSATERLAFRDQFVGDEDLKTFINSILPVRGSPSLAVALEASKRIFQEDNKRPNARKVLIIISDKSSVNTPQEIELAATPLENAKIRVVSVALGNEGSSQELEKTTPEKGNVIKARDDVDPKKLMEDIARVAFKTTPIVPNIDLGFAFTAGSTNAEETFSLMKSTIKYIVETHGQKRLHFAFIVFGDSPTVQLNFGKDVPTDAEIIRKIESLPRSSGSPDLAKGLEEAKNVFLTSGSRPNADKVLVVMVDRKSVNTPDELANKAKALQGRDIKVVPVLVGNEADPGEGSVLVPNKGDVIKARKNEEPKNLGAQIILAALKGSQKIPKLDLVFAISADTASLYDTYGFMKRIVKSVINKYGTESVRYGLLVYGDTPSVKLGFEVDQSDPVILKRLIDTMGPRSGGSNLEKALKEVGKMFESRFVRPGAIKALVIMTDRKSDSKESATRKAALALKDQNIQIVAVALGRLVDPGPIKEILKPDIGNVLNATTKEEPTDIADKIADIVGKDPLEHLAIDLGFVISATTADFATTYRLMKDTIKDIIDRYGTSNIRYSVIVYGSIPVLVTHFRDPLPIPELLKRRIEKAPRGTGGAALDRALDEAKRVFERYSTRPNVRKILVVITDADSGVGKNDIRCVKTD